MIERTARRLRPGTAAAVVACCAIGGPPVLAVEPPPPGGPAAAQAETPASGLPSIPGLEWRFHLDASFGVFGFANSLYADPRPDEPSGNLSDNWFEGAARPGLSATYAAAGGWQLYGKLSAAGEGSYGTPPNLIGGTSSSFLIDDAFLGWRSGPLLGLGENALDFTMGRAPYQLGHGFLLADGAAEGGSRGGYWTNVRKAFAFAAIGRFKPGRHTFEAFYLVRDELPEAESGTRVAGLNYELSLGEATTLGASYLRAFAHRDVRPTRDGMNVLDLRAYTAPFAKLPGLAFEAEYALERNADLLDAMALTLQAGYQLEVPWKPRLSYRFAWFEGDDPATSRSEAFDPLFPGFYDWGTWWQGEIAGEYFVSNSNLVSHQVRLHTAPLESLGTGIIFYDFLVDRPSALGAAVTSRNLALELDWYGDWKMNEHFTVSPVLAWARPGKAVEQAYGRTRDFWYGMLFVAYSY